MIVSIGSLQRNLARLDELLKAGVRVIKLKVRGNVDMEIRRVRAIARKLGNVPFYVDANQGYKLRDAMTLSKILLDTGALFSEQPVDRYDFDSLRLLRETGGVPIMLDESIFTSRDVIEAIRKEAADCINVKHVKSGGSGCL